MQSITIAILLSCLIIGCAAQQLELTPQQVEELCNNLKKNGFSPVRCAKPEEDFGRHGRNFRARFPRTADSTLAPVVLIPGFGGSALEATLNKNDSPAWYCFERWDWFRLWLALTELFVQDCWLDNMKIHFDPTTGLYNNTYGVQIRGMDFGGVNGINYLDTFLGIGISFTSVYATMIESLEEVGYVSGENLRGVPYDWRLPPNAEGSELYENIQQLIETTYASNGNTPVHVVTHSMGGPLFLYFLNQMSSSWKDQYIASFIPIAGPWAGSPKALRGLVSGDNFGIEILGLSLANKLKFREAVRESGGLAMLVPDPTFWEDQVFVYTPQKNYTASDIKDLFYDIGANDTADVYGSVHNFIPQLSAPEVVTHCLYGINQPTEFFYHYETGDFNADPTLIDYSDLGDGTVPERSLKECNTWSKMQSQPVSIKEVDTSDHTEILEDPDVIEYILTIVTGN